MLQTKRDRESKLPAIKEDSSEKLNHNFTKNNTEDGPAEIMGALAAFHNLPIDKRGGKWWCVNVECDISRVLVPVGSLWKARQRSHLWIEEVDVWGARAGVRVRR